jgi:hypothetical protein
VLALLEIERALLTERILESLKPDPEALTDVELIGELERRRTEGEPGLVKPIPWSEVHFED